MIDSLDSSRFSNWFSHLLPCLWISLISFSLSSSDLKGLLVYGFRLVFFCLPMSVRVVIMSLSSSSSEADFYDFGWWSACYTLSTDILLTTTAFEFPTSPILPFFLIFYEPYSFSNISERYFYWSLLSNWLPFSFWLDSCVEAASLNCWFSLCGLSYLKVYSMSTWFTWLSSLLSSSSESSSEFFISDRSFKLTFLGVICSNRLFLFWFIVPSYLISFFSFFPLEKTLIISLAVKWWSSYFRPFVTSDLVINLIPRWFWFI